MNSTAQTGLSRDVLREVGASCASAGENLRWLLDRMHVYFAITMQDEPAAVAALAVRLQQLRKERQLVLADRDNRLVVAKFSSLPSISPPSWPARSPRPWFTKGTGRPISWKCSRGICSGTLLHEMDYADPRLEGGA